jgi:hypothetical protein
MTITLPLSQGYVTIVDDEDADLMIEKWSVYAHGVNTQYAVRITNGTPKRLHRVILERVLGRKLDPRESVDHIDGDGLNNRRSNLRLASSAENNRNRRVQRNNATGFKGVSYDRGMKRFGARIYIQKTLTRLGWFDTAEEAHRAYCEAAILHYGPYANDGTKPLRLADAPIATKQLSLFADLERAS